MQAASMTSPSHSIQSLIAQVSGLVGLFVFLNQAWGLVPLERTLLTAFGAGLAAYVVLVLGYALTQRILAYTPPDDAADEPDAAADDAPAASSTAEPAAPQRQAA